MNQKYFHKVGIGIALLTLSQLLGCGTSSTKTTPPPPVTPQITAFSATPATVNSGQTATISWVTTNAASVSITPAVPQPSTGTLPVTGSAVLPLPTTTTFTLTARSEEHTS